MIARTRCARVARPVGGAAPSALALLHEAHARLREAAGCDDPLDRYVGAHLAALRAAAAVLAARGSPDPPVWPRRRRPASAWVLLPVAAPELTEWAALFAAGARRRAAAEAGVRGAATDRDADDLVVDVGTFLAIVETTLGLLRQPLPARPSPG